MGYHDIHENQFLSRSAAVACIRSAGHTRDRHCARTGGRRSRAGISAGSDPTDRGGLRRRRDHRSGAAGHAGGADQRQRHGLPRRRRRPRQARTGAGATRCPRYRRAGGGGTRRDFAGRSGAGRRPRELRAHEEPGGSEVHQPGRARQGRIRIQGGAGRRSRLRAPATCRRIPRAALPTFAPRSTAS